MDPELGRPGLEDQPPAPPGVDAGPSQHNAEEGAGGLGVVRIYESVKCRDHPGSVGPKTDSQVLATIEYTGYTTRYAPSRLR